MSKNKSFKIVVMSGFVLASFVGASAQNQAFSSQRLEHSPNEDLIYAVEGCKTGAAVLVGIINPIAGVLVAASQSSESKSDLKGIQKALDRGADINYRDNDSWTALMHSAYGGYPKISEFLLSKGAQKDLVVTKSSAFSNWKGYTAFQIAKYYLDRYENCLKSCEPDMVKFYTKRISKYGRIANLLK